MKSILVYEFSLRLFHWAFAASITASLILALAVDEHSALFRWHMIFGIVAGFLLLLRLVLGLVGSRYSRFSRMPLGPMQLIAYARSLLDRGATRHPGHSPGSAWAAVAMFTAVPAILATGLWAGRDPWEEVHGILAYALMAVIGAHLAGIAWHTIKHRENIAASMISGRKLGEPTEAITSAQPAWALVFVVTATAWIGGLFSNYRAGAPSIRLPLSTITVNLGEGKEDEKSRPRGKSKHDHDDN
jgi:cytochrome b